MSKCCYSTGSTSKLAFAAVYLATIGTSLCSVVVFYYFFSSEVLSPFPLSTVPSPATDYVHIVGAHNSADLDV